MWRQRAAWRTESLVRVPIDLGAALGAQQVLNGKAMQLLAIAEGANDVPAQAIDIDPAARGPVLLGFLQKGVERVIVELVRLYAVVGKVYDGDLAGGVEVVVASGVCVVLCVDTRLRAGLLALVGTGGGLVVADCVGAGDAPAQGVGRGADGRADLVSIRGGGCGRGGRYRPAAAPLAVELVSTVGRLGDAGDAGDAKSWTRVSEGEAAMGAMLGSDGAGRRKQHGVAAQPSRRATEKPHNGSAIERGGPP